MKKVLIVGSGSYIGASFEQYAQGRISISTIDARNGEWEKISYSEFESIVYVAGIAHRRQTRGNKNLYFAVNRDLAVAVAQKAKVEGAGQFVYLSSMAIYGIKSGEITGQTIPNPSENDYYAFSKLQTEERLNSMQAANFDIAIIRPPMVYGMNCKGKFQQLVKIAKILPFIPTIQNKRSMIFIDNLAECMTLIIDQGLSGTFCPQNAEYVCTSDIFCEVLKIANRRIVRLPLATLLIRILMPISISAQSAFGSLYYSKEMSRMPFDMEYQLVAFGESVRRSVNA